MGDLYALARVCATNRTDQQIINYLPSPLSQHDHTSCRSPRTSNYAKLLPSLNLAYDVTDTFKLRAAATETYGRPEYAQLAENSSATRHGHHGNRNNFQSRSEAPQIGEFRSVSAE